MTQQPVALDWTVHGLHIAGLAWGDPAAPAILCLHGWMDNAASFAVLAPLLENHYIVAPDLTGHGQSDRRSADATYQIWDDLPEVLGIIDELDWEHFSLVGHSRGAVIASLFAASYPERVRHLIMLDAVGPQPVAEDEFPAQMRRFLQDKGRLLLRENRKFPSVADAVASRVETGLGQAAAALIAERNLRPTEGGFTWTTDPRLRGPSAVKLTPGQVDAALGALVMPTLLLLAEQGHGGRYPGMQEMAQRCIPQLSLAQLPGEHHFHMETSVPELAQLILEFMQ